ncbi:hypothetical protein C8R45DRAFT_929028 [Mycena sanguinolenta]|nr:hypothetical protein C8R45DRAFT_929028 [Mycena sanguinolenta]
MHPRPNHLDAAGENHETTHYPTPVPAPRAEMCVSTQGRRSGEKRRKDPTSQDECGEKYAGRMQEGNRIEVKKETRTLNAQRRRQQALGRFQRRAAGNNAGRGKKNEWSGGAQVEAEMVSGTGGAKEGKRRRYSSGRARATKKEGRRAKTAEASGGQKQEKTRRDAPRLQLASAPRITRLPKPNRRPRITARYSPAARREVGTTLAEVDTECVICPATLDAAERERRRKSERWRARRQGGEVVDGLERHAIRAPYVRAQGRRCGVFAVGSSTPSTFSPVRPVTDLLASGLEHGESGGGRGARLGGASGRGRRLGRLGRR